MSTKLLNTKMNLMKLSEELVQWGRVTFSDCLEVFLSSSLLQSNRENCEHLKYFWNVIVLQEKASQALIKLNRKQERQLVCGFVATPHALIFA